MMKSPIPHANQATNHARRSTRLIRCEGPAARVHSFGTWAAAGAVALLGFAGVAPLMAQEIGSERAIAEHLAPGAEFDLSPAKLVARGATIFAAKFTARDGHGRPRSKGTFSPLVDTNEPLVFPRNMNRISSPEASSCAGCHMDPLPGGSGEFLTNAFVSAERFDYVTFDPAESLPTKGAFDENGAAVMLESVGNIRSTPQLFGSGYVELLAREITNELQALRDSLGDGAAIALESKGLSFGTLSRNESGGWVTSAVEGIPASSLVTTGPSDPPSLLIRPFGWSGGTSTLRHFTVTAFNHHIGMQAVERAGSGNDPDADSVVDELSVGDITAVTMFQATLPPPGRVIPKSELLRAAVQSGESLFVSIGCATCHVPCLPLVGDEFSEPSPFNPAGNLQQGDLYHATFGSLIVDLSDSNLPKPRLKMKSGVIAVPLFSDLRVHDISDGPSDPNHESLDLQFDPSNDGFFEGSGTFITPRLWGVGTTGPYFHHGKFTTLEQAILGHGGEASNVRSAYQALTEIERQSVIEFLKSLRILPPDAPSLTIDEKGKKVKWPAFPWECGAQVPDVP